MIAEIKDWLGLISLVISVGMVLWGWLTAGDKRAVKDLSAKVSDLAEACATKADIADLKARVHGLAEAGAKLDERADRHDRRIQSIESDMKHLPDREQAHRMELAIERLGGRVDTLAKSMEPIAAISERWQELILEQAKK